MMPYGVQGSKACKTRVVFYMNRKVPEDIPILYTKDKYVESMATTDVFHD